MCLRTRRNSLDNDPAVRYYVRRAEEPQIRRTTSLIHRSVFRPLTRVCYDLIGQDHALEQLFRVLSVQSQQYLVAPIVVLLCGKSHSINVWSFESEEGHHQGLVVTARVFLPIDVSHGI
jgi:hypothetical protein